MPARLPLRVPVAPLFVALLLAVAALLAPLPVLAARENLGPARYLHRQGARSLPELLRAELAAADKQKQGVLIMFTADWCSPCKAVKHFVAASASVRKALGKARLLYIDVDEWRGPAQSLIPGIDAGKLPTLVRVDGQGRSMRSCFGTDLGLLHEDAVAHNLGRLLAGQAPDKPFYADKPELERQFMLQQAQAQTALTKGVKELEVKATGAGKVRLVIRNHDGPRRWYLVPARLDVPMADRPSVKGWQQVRWSEHTRADYLRFTGPLEFYAIPVAGYGSVTLDDWPLHGKGKLAVWELDRLSIDGQDQQFQMKLPYDLAIKHPDQTSAGLMRGPAKVELRVRKKHEAVVK